MSLAISELFTAYPQLQIVFMAVSMFIITFFIGFLPTKLPIEQRVMNLISLFGAGLLVGAALIIIVPEGMTVLSNAINDASLEKNKVTS
jgi:zinc transporter 9